MSFDSQFKSADLINDGYVWENLSSNLSLYLAALRICDKRDVRWSQDVTQPRLTLCRSVSISHLFLCISLPLSVHFSNTFLLFPFFFVSLSLSPGGQFYSVDDFTQGNYLALLHVWLWILWASMVYCYPSQGILNLSLQREDGYHFPHPLYAPYTHLMPSVSQDTGLRWSKHLPVIKDSYSTVLSNTLFPPPLLNTAIPVQHYILQNKYVRTTWGAC